MLKNNHLHENQHTWKKRNHRQIAKRESCIFQGPLHQRPLRTWSRSQQGEDQQTTNVLLTLLYIFYSFVLGGDHRQLRGGVRVPAGQRGAHRGLPRVPGGHCLAQVDFEESCSMFMMIQLITTRMQEFLVKLAKAKDARQAVHDYYDQL